MKKLLIGIAITVFLIIFGWVTSYTTLVDTREDVRVSWGKVQSALKRRTDLIPNLVRTAQGYAKHEKSIFDAITQARDRVTAVNMKDIELDPVRQKQLLEAQGQLTAALGKLIALSESTPELKADKVFINLQFELAGTENRINAERIDSQKKTGAYNKARLGFFSRIVASTYGFTEISYYDAGPAAEIPPTVEFN